MINRFIKQKDISNEMILLAVTKEANNHQLKENLKTLKAN